MDDSKILERGEATIQTRDATPTTIVITATDTVVTSNSPEIKRISASCPTQQVYATEPGSEIGTKSSRQFFEVRDTTLPDFPDETLQELESSSASSFGESNLVFGYVRGDLDFDPKKVALPQDTEIKTLANRDVGSSYSLLQTASTQIPTYRTSDLDYDMPSLLFDGDDWYDIAQSDLLYTIAEEEDFVLSMVVGFTTLVGVQTLFAQFLNTADNGSVFLEYDGTLKWTMIGDGTLGAVTLDAGVLVAGETYLIQVERSGLTYTVYLNGVSQDTVTEASSRKILQTGSLLGARTTTTDDYKASLTNFFSGSLSLFKVDRTPKKEEDFDQYDFEFSTGLEISYLTQSITSWRDATLTPWITTSGGVEQWDDPVGKGTVSFRSNSSTYRPTYSEDVYNGHNAYLFNGSSQHMFMDGVVRDLNQGFTIGMCVLFQNASGTVEYISSFQDLSLNKKLHLGYVPTTNLFVLDYENETFVSSLNTYNENVPLAVVWNLNPTTGLCEVWVNGNLEISQIITDRITSSDTYQIAASYEGSLIPRDTFRGYYFFHAISSSYAPHMQDMLTTYMIGRFFTPSDLDDIFAAYSVLDPGTAYLDGDPVTSLQDLSGNLRNALQASAPLQPTYTLDALNGKPSVTYTGVEQLDISTLFGDTLGSTTTQILLARNDTEVEGYLVTTKGSATDGYHFGFNSSNEIVYEHGGHTPVVSRNFAYSDAQVVSACRNSLDIEASRGGRYKETTTLTGYTTSTGTTTSLGGNANSTRFTGDLFEACFFDRKLNPGEVRGVGCYYNRLYRLNLPTKPTLSNMRFEFDVLKEVGYVNGNLVTALTDQTGTSDAVQGTSSSRATYKESYFGGLPTLYFDGGDAYVTGTTALDPTGGKAIVFVGNFYKDFSGSKYLFHIGADTDTNREAFSLGFDNNDLILDNRNSEKIPLGVTTGYQGIHIITYESGRVYYYLNGKLMRSLGYGPSVNTEHPLTIGDETSADSSANRFQGWMSYFAYLESYISPKEAQDFTHYLARYYNIPI
jgi:hypothetical protein